MSDATENAEPPPKRVNKMRYPRDFLLEDEGRICGLQRSLLRPSKIVEETTTKEILDNIVEMADAETVTAPLKAELRAGSPDGGSDGDGEDNDDDDDENGDGDDNEEDDDDDDVAPCEGTFAICCAADLSLEVMNCFTQQKASGNLFNMAFVDSLSNYYDDGTEFPVQTPSSTSSPFKGKSPHECYLLLKRLVRETESRIDWQESVIVDEQTLEDGTVVLVTIPPEDGEEAIWVRAAMHLASQALMCTRSGSVGLDEIIEDIQEEQGISGVLRHLG